jgi:hypothetical protein
LQPTHGSVIRIASNREGLNARLKQREHSMLQE